MPLPIDTLLRVHASPVPAQIVFGACGSMATAPMDCAPSLSNTGLNVVPPFEDFQTPPLAAPAYTVSRPSSFTAAIAATRPLMAAEPMFRAPRPEIVSESNLVFCAGAKHQIRFGHNFRSGCAEHWLRGHERTRCGDCRGEGGWPSHCVCRSSEWRRLEIFEWRNNV